MSPAAPAPRLAPPTTVIEVPSGADGARAYRLLITPPPAPAPAAGHPVLWLLDGNAYNGLLVDLVRNRGALGGEFAPPVVVAVGYVSDDISQWMSRRTLDLTPTGGDGSHPLESLPGHAFGGLDELLDRLGGDFLHRVAAMVPVDPSRMALMGHSLGGMAVLHALFTRPRSFQSFLALSPSIWWHSRVLLGHEAAFAEAVQSGAAAPRVFIAVGGTEQDPPVRRAGVSDEQFATAEALAPKLRMVDNAAELVVRLRALRGAEGYAVRYECPPGETHMSLPFVCAGHALDLAFPAATSASS